ncbi:hypothetical protein LWE61_16795 [Sphingobium sufflavum]|uniref:hypothetical protein n=1 Tax=Sphingobium sufflavum TaxID=1129547 RepID=UPI001F27EEE0|nr:hypothetical protein [Sphingobium sufflavum]MCE7798199.1 hypothetical protein [Sphingobium sufflavum]
MICRAFGWGGWSAIAVWLNQWQTMITGGLALLAAFIAVRPVYRQLALMRAQNSVMVRGTVVEMIRQLDADSARVPEIIRKPLAEVHSSLQYFEAHGRQPSHFAWIDDQTQTFGRVSTAFLAFSLASYDVETIEGKKHVMSEALGALYNAFWTIHLPEYADRSPEDFNWSDEQSAAALKDANKAEATLPYVAGKVSAAFRDLDAAYDYQRAVLLRRLRKIDDSLLTQDVA